MTAAKKRRTKRYRPGRVDANPIRLAMLGAGKMPPADRAVLAGIRRRALEALVAGVADELDHWAQLVDIVNLSEALSGLGICSDEGSRARITAAVTVLGELMDARDAGASSLRPSTPQLAALTEAVWLHGVQVEHCSLSEFELAYRRVVARTRAALAGSVGKGVKVVTSGRSA